MELFLNEDIPYKRNLCVFKDSFNFFGFKMEAVLNGNFVVFVCLHHKKNGSFQSLRDTEERLSNFINVGS